FGPVELLFQHVKDIIVELAGGEDKSTRILRDVYTSEREIAADGKHPREVSRLEKQRRNVIVAKRRRLAAMRRADEID
ncbi:hypothetical protein AB9F35_36805, partial [Rhizobium leguminosarum]